MSFVDWFMASFLYCFPYSCRSFTLLKAFAKSNGNLIAIAFKSDNNYRYRDSLKSDNLERKQSKNKQRTDTIKDAKRIKSDNFTRGNREKSNIAIVILEICMIGL